MVTIAYVATLSLPRTRRHSWRGGTIEILDRATCTCESALSLLRSGM